MSITTSRDIFCDVCPQWTQGCIEGNAKKARKNARVKGWKQRRVGSKVIDICPSCLESEAKNEQE